MDRTVRNGTISPTDARRKSGHNLSNDHNRGKGNGGWVLPTMRRNPQSQTKQVEFKLFLRKIFQAGENHLSISSLKQSFFVKSSSSLLFQA